jgi:hypothetical protein
MSGGQSFYSEQEAHEILELAARNEGVGGVSRDSLLQTAAELGISPDAVLAAEEKYHEDRRSLREEKEFKGYRRRQFFDALSGYIVVNSILLAINLLKSPGSLWSLYIIFGWGVGMLFYTRSTFFPRAEEYRADFEKWRLRRSLARSDVDTVIRDVIRSRSDSDRVKIVTQVRDRTGIELDEARLAVENYYARRKEEKQQQQQQQLGG